MTAKIRRLFIANRGEIARRIALTARRLGIESVALSDRDVPPAYLLDAVTRVVRVADETPALYLDAQAMLAHARQAGCDAVHPGFGFLSENAGFAAAVQAAGLTWVGPSPAAIGAMASKATARGHATKAKVPVVGGISGFPVPTDEQGDFAVLEAFAEGTGYPLLLKAAFGGGGKGMRIVTKKAELRPAVLRAASEALNSFGDSALICEQYLTAPRHVEVQILADQHGRVVAVGDRDCSLQRRHQKIIEEAPAVGLTDATRQALHAAAVNLAAAVGYDSTGTVEFLVDWTESSRTAPLQRFFFLEMNTRLQVEHPVTEEVFGIDLVEWQLRVASGERLPEDFCRLAPRGHSVEARLYAEDTRKGFFPSPGPVAAFRPAQGPGLRWELGLDPVDEITGRFDPMVAKLVATAATREGALARLDDALARTVLAGPANNIDLLRQLAVGSAFAAGPVTTHFLSENLDDLLADIDRRLARHEAVGRRLLDELAADHLGKAPGPEGTDAETRTQAIFARSGGSLGGVRSMERQATRTTAAPVLALMSHEAAGPAGPAGRPAAQSGTGTVADPGAPADAPALVFWYAALKRGSESQYWVSVAGSLYQRRVERGSPAHGARGAGVSSAVLAPVPGKVIAVNVSAGASVEVGQTVLVLESMKMEFEVKATQTGVLAEISVKSGDQVSAGQLLAKWAEG